MKELAIVVEDDEDLAAIFTEALQKANYQVETIRDGLSAQRRIIQIEPHLVVLDMHIPYVSGAENIATNPRGCTLETYHRGYRLRLTPAWVKRLPILPISC